jgi:hypothetical protein
MKNLYTAKVAVTTKDTINKEELLLLHNIYKINEKGEVKTFRDHLYIKVESDFLKKQQGKVIFFLAEEYEYTNLTENKKKVGLKNLSVLGSKFLKGGNK